MKTYPVLQAQLGVFLECQTTPRGTEYNNSVCFELDYDIDLDRLEQALLKVVHNRPVMRTRFLIDEDGNVRQWSDPAMQIPITRRKCSDSELQAYLKNGFLQPFDLLAGEPLVRFELVETEVRPYLLTDFHHCISDGTTIDILFSMEDLMLAYDGKELAAPEHGMYEVAEEEQASFATAEYRQDQEYYAGKWEGVSFVALPHSSRDEKNHKLHIEKASVERSACDAWCIAHGVKPCYLLEAALALVLSRLSRQSRTAFISLHHGRFKPEMGKYFGMFIKNMPVLVDLAADVTIKDLLQSLRDELHDFRRHAVYPFTHFCRDLKLSRGVSFNFMDRSDDVSCFTCLGGKRYFHDRVLSQDYWSEINVDCRAYKDRYFIIVYASLAMYDPDFVRRIAEAVCHTAVNIMAAADDARLQDISIVSAEEKQELLALGSGYQTEYDRSRTVVDMFLQWARETPQATAVVDSLGSFSYAELERRSNIIASALVNLGVKANDFVVVKLPRVKEFLLAVMAIWKAGAAYVPVDPEYPEERIRYMVEDAGARIVIDSRFLAGLDFTQTAAPLNLSSPDKLAYMIYTSGSTGKPKGVMIAHESLRALMSWLPAELELKPGDNVAEHASFSFDASICDLYTSIVSGATLHIWSEELRKDLPGLAAYINAHRIVGATFSTQLGMELLNSCRINMRYIILGGEKLKHVAATTTRIYNGYGPTEFTCWSSHHIVNQEQDGDDIPIGRPVPNTISAIVDPAGRLLPRGTMGELVLLGTQIARGYWQRPELTAERFADAPFLPGQKMYRTGDLARWNEAGELLYCGRIDNQVKLRGFRVEMGEIESALSKFPGILTSAAAVKTLNGVPHLVAYYVSETEIAEKDLQAELAKVLTEYMVPDVYVRLDKLPLTPNGKIDRKALPDVNVALANYAEPEGENEKNVAAIFQELLNLNNPVGREDDFIALGGDSIQSIRLVSKLRAVGIVVTVADIMKARTVKDIAALAGQAACEEADQRDWSGEVPLTAIQSAFFHDWQMAHPEHFNMAQMLTASKRLDEGTLSLALKALACHHDMLRAVYRNGVQYVRPTDGEGPLFELETVPTDDVAVISEVAERIQGSFDLEKAPLLKAVLFRGAEADYLLLVVHHLVADGISMRILLEDLNTAYGQIASGQEVTLPAKTASFRDWRAAVGRYAESDLFRSEIPYWENLDRRMRQLPHVEKHGRKTCQLVKYVPAEIFSSLVGSALNAYHNEINDLMLTALCRAYWELTGQRTLAVSMEGHGREPLHEVIAIDRTVGWFTSQYPVVLEYADDLRENLLNVKNNLRLLPHHGFDYGIFHHMASLSEEPECIPTISFNYLGRFSESDSRNIFSINNTLPQGYTISLDNVFGSNMMIVCQGIADGRLWIAFKYDTSVWTQAEAEKLADNFSGQIQAVVAHTLSVKEAEITAADLGEHSWDELDFATVKDEFAARNETLENLYPLSSMQNGMLLKMLAEPESAAYHITVRFKLDIPLTESQLNYALTKLAEKHEVLRTAIIYKNVPEPRQAVIGGRILPADYRDLSGEPDPDAACAELEQCLFRQPIDLQSDPLFRAVAVKTGTDSCQLIFVIHHIIIDGWSNSVWFADLGRFLNEFSLQQCPNEDFSSRRGRFERHVRDIVSRDSAAAKEYWRRLLDGYETKAEIPAYENVTDANRSQSNELQVALAEDTTSALLKACRRAGCTLNNAVEAALGILLQKYNRTDDAVFVKVVSGRGQAEEDVADLVGIFLNSVPVRVKTEPGETVLELLQKNQQQSAATSEHDWLALADIQAQNTLGHDLFQVILAFENYAKVDSSDEALNHLKLLSVQETNVSEFTVAAFVVNDKLCLKLQYDTDKYTANEIRRAGGALQNILTAFADNPEQKIAQIALVSPEEAAGLLELGRGYQAEYDRRLTVVDLFLRWVSETPQATAVVDAQGSLSYAELDSRSNILAGELLKSGVQANDFVAVKLPRVKEFMLAVVAIWKAGAAYIPVDLEYPEERIRYMVEDSEAKIIIDEQFLARIDFAQEAAPLNLASPDKLAYMIYTSGSTGKPKGAMIAHESLQAFLSWLPAELELQPGDNVAEHVSFCFDGSICDLYTSIARGATLHIWSEELRKDLPGLAAYINEHKIVGATFTTLLGMELLNACPINMRYIILGGEKLKHVAPTSTRIYNGYGPTEFTCLSSVHIVDQEHDGDDIPIGRPVHDSISAIVDPEGNLLPRGLTGELVLLGTQMARGYWHRPELTAERFTQAPFLPGHKMYRTGDLARWNEDGELLCCGRIDNQIKLRGFRIELGEIEAALAKFPGISGAVAEVKTINGIQHLVAYYVASTEIDETSLQAELAQVLTEYMLPDAFLRLDKMPLTPGGKVNRKALPVPEWKEEEAVAPANGFEKKALEVVVRELGTDKVGVTTNLISMGLTSIRAIRLAAMVSRATGRKIRTGDILSHPRIRSWQGLADAHTGDEAIEIRPARESYPLTDNQMGIYLSWEHNRDGLQYNIPMAWRLPNAHAEDLVRALEKVIDAHPYLKLRLENRNGEIVQVRRDSAQPEILRQHLEQEPEASFFQSRVRAFDLLKDGLARFEVYEAPEAAYLFLDIHHILFDGTSAYVLLSALDKAYGGMALEFEKASAYDYALFCENWQKSSQYDKAGKYFGELLCGTESFQYPSACTQAVASGILADCQKEIPALTIRSRCRELGITENAFFATVLCEVFHRISRNESIQISTVSSGRSLDQLNNTIGMFVQTLPLVWKVEKETVSARLRAMQEQFALTLQNELFPYTVLSEKYQVTPDVLYVYQGDVLPDGENRYLKREAIKLKLDTAKAPLSVNVVPLKDSYLLVLEYDSGLYTAADIEQLVKALVGLSSALSTFPLDTQIGNVPLLLKEESHQLLELGSGEELDYDRQETLVDLFLKQVGAAPQATAVVDSVSSFTYGELDRLSSILAGQLLARGVQNHDFVIVKLPRVKEFVLAVIAVWKAGAAYVPVDPEYPEERIRYMMEDSEAQIIVDELFLAGIDFTQAAPALNLASPDKLAYMIYTSGSTGKPKGVMVPHANVRAFAEWRLKLTGAQACDAFAHHISFSFDASLDDLVTSLAAGATLHILNDAARKDLGMLYGYLLKNRIAGLSLPTQFGTALLNEYGDLPIRFLMMGGEKLLLNRPSSTQIINGYGPTEFTVCSSYHLVDQEHDGDNIPIGRPVPNSISAIVDPEGNLLPRGVTGELVLLGAQIARGYWHRPDLTAEKFANALFRSGQKMYRTGDLARWSPLGELLYCGRLDNQVKLRGFRIEMGEIEAALAKFPGVSSAVAEIKTISGVQHLVAYYVSETDVNENDLKTELGKVLTEYMVPDVFLRLETMPLTPNGKIDRKALPLPDLEFTQGEYVEPETEAEKIICQVFGETLKIEHFGVTTDFFKAGGTSLLGIRVVADLQRHKFDVVYGDIFRCKTPRALAEFLTKSPESQKESVHTFDYGDYDYTKIDAVLQGTRSELFSDFTVHPLGNVLLTGATGYLGIHVLKYLLDATDCRVGLLIRSKHNMLPNERMETGCVYYFDDLLPEEYTKRLVFIEGDITDRDLHDKLAVFPYDTAFNCAALVKHYVADDQMDRTNVEGVRNLIDCCSKDQARLIQTSTYSIGGVIDRESEQVLDERSLYIGQTSDNDYIRTKFLAERYVLEAVASGQLKGKIMRLGNLMGRESDGEFQINIAANAFVNSLKTFTILGAYPLMQMVDSVEMSPIDRVAEAIVRLASTPDDMVVFQPFNTYHTDMGAMLEAIVRSGHPIDYVSNEEFAARVEDLRNDPSRVKYLQGILHYGSHILANQKMSLAVNTWTTTVLYRLGFRWKQPEERYLEKFLQVLARMRVFQR